MLTTISLLLGVVAIVVARLVVAPLVVVSSASATADPITHDYRA